MNTPSAAALSDTLAEHHRRFLDFLVRRVGSEALAEDILQDAYAKSIEKGTAFGTTRAWSPGSTASP
jgi:DNA-directed RNA polymerase specialized sigma24 family protein